MTENKPKERELEPRWWRCAFYFPKNYESLEPEYKAKIGIRRLAAGFFLFVVLAWGTTFAIAMVAVCKNGSAAGQFGDVFGSINALFSGLAFAGVILTIWMQREELDLQRKELRDTREVFEQQKNQMELQNETLRKQQFEATFFQMFRFFEEHRRVVHYDREIGLPALRQLRNNAVSRDRANASGFESAMRTREYEDNLGPYLRVYSNLCTLVESADVTDKRPYWHLLRDTLTAPEAMLVLLFCNTKIPPPLLKALIVSHGLLHSVKNDIDWPFGNRDWDPRAFEAF